MVKYGLKLWLFLMSKYKGYRPIETTVSLETSLKALAEAAKGVVGPKRIAHSLGLCENTVRAAKHKLPLLFWAAEKD